MDAAEQFEPGDDNVAGVPVTIIDRTRAAYIKVSAAQAGLARVLAEAEAIAESQATPGVGAEHEMSIRSMAAELSVVARVGDRSVQRQMADAAEVVGNYPLVFAAWERGAITRAHVYVVTDIGAPLPPSVREEFEGIALAHCLTETANRVRPVLQLVAERLHPRSLSERHEEAFRTRDVRCFDLPNGVSELSVVGSTTVIHAVYDRLTRQARAGADAPRVPDGTDGAPGLGLGGAVQPIPVDVVASDERTMDQIRADLCLDMLLTSVPSLDATADDGPGQLGAIRAVVQVTVPVTTLAGIDDDPARLAGASPVDAESARWMAGHAPGWDRVLTHAVTGTVLETDHTIDAQFGGPTSAANLAHLCRRHHSLKHWRPDGAGHWKVTQLPGGELRWTTPHGQVVTDTPPITGPPGVQFVPDPAVDPPPF